MRHGCIQKYMGRDNDNVAPDQSSRMKMPPQILFRQYGFRQAYVIIADRALVAGAHLRLAVPPDTDQAERRCVRVARDELVRRPHRPTRRKSTAKSGVVNDGDLSAGCGHVGFHWITPFHNDAGMLYTELGERAASRAPAVHFRPNQLDRGEGARSRGGTNSQTHFINPWPGG